NRSFGKGLVVNFKRHSYGDRISGPKAQAHCNAQQLPECVALAAVSSRDTVACYRDISSERTRREPLSAVAPRCTRGPRKTRQDGGALPAPLTLLFPNN